jgi:hypothetical protein
LQLPLTTATVPGGDRLCKEVESLSGRKTVMQEANQAKRKFLHGLRSRLQKIAQVALSFFVAFLCAVLTQ